MRPTGEVAVGGGWLMEGSFDTGSLYYVNAIIGLIWSFQVLSLDVLITGNWKTVIHYVIHIKVNSF